MIKELEKRFIGRGEVKDFNFEQVAANGHGYIYRVDGTSGGYYEVFKRREVETFDMIDGVRHITGKKVAYPSSKAFGIWAWTCFKMGHALYRLNKISERKEDQNA